MGFVYFIMMIVISWVIYNLASILRLDSEAGRLLGSIIISSIIAFGILPKLSWRIDKKRRQIKSLNQLDSNERIKEILDIINSKSEVTVVISDRNIKVDNKEFSFYFMPNGKNDTIQQHAIRDWLYEHMNRKSEHSCTTITDYLPGTGMITGVSENMGGGYSVSYDGNTPISHCVIVPNEIYNQIEASRRRTR